MTPYCERQLLFVILYQHIAEISSPAEPFFYKYKQFFMAARTPGRKWDAAGERSREERKTEKIQLFLKFCLQFGTKWCKLDACGTNWKK
jgi:hypothetical protein